jgi:hypothetical protein
MVKNSTALKRALKVTLLVVLGWASSGSGGCSCGSTPSVNIVTNGLDRAYCNVQAVACIHPLPCTSCDGSGPPATACPAMVLGQQCVVGLTIAGCATDSSTGNLDTSCKGSCPANAAACASDPTSPACQDNPATCTSCKPSIVFPQAPVCFDHNTMTATEACNNLCALPVNPDAPDTGPGIPTEIYPPALRGQGFCSGSVVPPPSGLTYNGTSTGASGADFVLHGCDASGGGGGATHGQALILPPTNQVQLEGSGTFSSPANHVSPQGVTITSGVINLAAPSTQGGAPCNAEGASCLEAVNQIEVTFEDFQVSISGDPHSPHSVNGLTLYLDVPFLTGGTFIPALPPAAPHDQIQFLIPDNTEFGSVSTVDGTFEGLLSSSDQTTTGTLDLVTGDVVFSYELSEDVNGNAVMLNGMASTSQVVDVAPVVTMAPTVSAAAVTSCSTSVTINAAATSQVGLPLSVFLSVDDTFLATASSAPTTLAIGTHQATALAVDSLGGQTLASETITVSDQTAPQFSGVPSSEVIQGCTYAASGFVPVTVPTAADMCSGATASVVGTVVQFNGASTSIPVTGGTIPDAEGKGTLEFVATNPNGVTSTVDVPLSIVVPPPTIVGPPDVTITTCVNAVIGSATASNCLGSVPVSSDAPAKFPIGTTIVTWTATDVVGQTATVTQRVTAMLADDASCCPTGSNVIVGTAGSDVINGTFASDCILGLGGDDTIFGGGGNDFVSGGSGNDTINTSNGNSFVWGGAGNDTITAATLGNGVQYIDGGQGYNVCTAGPGTNIIVNCASETGCTNSCCSTNSCTEPTPPSPTSCSQPYVQASCLTYVQGTEVSAGGNNWTCANSNCAQCASVPACAPGASGCPWGKVWTNAGACH